jgi:hypothetical protein
MKRTNQRYINYKCCNPLYHINFDGSINTKTIVNISKYIPHIIKQLIHSIPKQFNKHYIICPYYQQYYDYQLGITETIKENETYSSAIHRGINEECGLCNIKWFNKLEITNNRTWVGVIIDNEQYDLKPNHIINTNKDTIHKVAIILHDNLYTLLMKYKYIKPGDINSDGIKGLGLLSVYDCKKIIT